MVFLLAGMALITLAPERGGSCVGRNAPYARCLSYSHAKHLRRAANMNAGRDLLCCSGAIATPLRHTYRGVAYRSRRASPCVSRCADALLRLSPSALPFISPPRRSATTVRALQQTRIARAAANAVSLLAPCARFLPARRAATLKTEGGAT